MMSGVAWCCVPLAEFSILLFKIVFLNILIRRCS